MTKTRTRTPLETTRMGMQTRSQSPKTPILVGDTNRERQVTAKDTNAPEVDALSQPDSAKKAPPISARAKGKQRRIRKSTSNADSEDNDDQESTDSDGPRRQQTKSGIRVREPHLRIADRSPPGQPAHAVAAVEESGRDALRSEQPEVTDVADLRRAVQQLAVAVAEMRKERRPVQGTDNGAEESDEEAIGRARLESRGPSGAAGQQRHSTAFVMANPHRHRAGREGSQPQQEEEQGRGQPRHRVRRSRYLAHRLPDEDDISEDSSETSNDKVRGQSRRRSVSQRRPSRRYQRVVRRGKSPSSHGSISSEDSDEENRRRGTRGGGNPRQMRSQPDDSDDDDPDDDGSDGDESSGTESDRSRSESRGRQRRHRRHPQRRHRERRERRRRERSEPAVRPWPSRPGNIKNLELPVFTPAPGVSAATWVDRVDLALQGARASGQGEWSDHALYFILGNKLMESAAMWWVTMNQRLTRRQQTWTYLKKELLKRFGPRKNKAAAEWRVNNRTMLNGESYDDFAAGLRRAADRNRVSERVFLAQYYRNLDKTTRQLVKMEPRPKTLEEAVAKTNRIDDPADNIAQGMRNIGQAFPMAPQTQLTTVAGTMGQTVVIPGVGGMSLPAELTEAVVNSTAAEPANKDAVTVFTNQQGVWNDYAGIYEKPPGRKWNGRFWEKVAAKRKTRRSPSTPGEPRKNRSKRIREDSGDESNQGKTEPKKKRATTKATTDAGRTTVARVGAIRQTAASEGGKQGCFRCGAPDHFSAQCPSAPQCYACHKPGHLARECPDSAAKAKNDEYLKQRATRIVTEQGNGERTS